MLALFLSGLARRAPVAWLRDRTREWREKAVWRAADVEALAKLGIEFDGTVKRPGERP
jgi:hypothetical protein